MVALGYSRESLKEKMTFEQRLERGERVGQVAVWGKSVPAEGRAAKARGSSVLLCSRSSKEPGVAEAK